MDAAITHAINTWAGLYPFADTLAIWASAAGVPLMVFAVAAQWWRRTVRMEIRHAVVAAGLSFLLGLAINQFTLLFVHRMRRYDAGVTHLLIERSADYSFPSDHATAAFAIAAAFLLHRVRRLGAAFLAAAVLIAFSRVYVGTHFMGDALGGALTGIWATGAVSLAYREGSVLDRFIVNIL